MALADSTLRRVKNNVIFRAFLLGALIVTLQFPILAIESLIYERSQSRREAEADIGRTWGPSQTVLGPVLSVPFRIRWVDEKGRTREDIAASYFLPQQLDINGSVKTEKRYRGIFEVPVYTTEITFAGSFSRPSFADMNVSPDDVLWDRATISLSLDSPRSIRDTVVLQWDGAKTNFESGLLPSRAGEQGIHAPVQGLQGGSDKHSFSVVLSMSGSSQLRFIPIGGETNVTLSSEWPDPGFDGDYLPITREVTAKGFNAHWKVLALGRGFPDHWTSREGAPQALHASAFGVSLLSPVDSYRMNDRLIKYELLIVFLTFLTFYLFEVFNRFFIHPVQYLLVGAGLCLFYLLCLSFSEHVGFGAAYLIASGAVVTLICGYSAFVLRSRLRATILGAVVVSQYGYFYVLLQEQDYALLLGSIGLTLVLGVIMYITRNIDWYNIGESAEQPA
ncbi:MAG: cell envelope integrity protein CreD [Bdellovibrionota bacterium]